MLEILKKYYLVYGEELIYHDIIMAELIALLWNSKEDELQFYNYFQLEKYLVDMGYISVYNDDKELIYPYMQHGIWYYKLHGDKIYDVYEDKKLYFEHERRLTKDGITKIFDGKFTELSFDYLDNENASSGGSIYIKITDKIMEL